MELVGTIEGESLEEYDSLQGILSSGIVGKAPFPLTDQIYVPGMEEWYKGKVEERRSRIIKSLEILTHEVPFESQENDFNLARNELVADYICSEIEAYFDRLSPELFNLKRKITRDVKGRYEKIEEAEFNIPLFAESGFNGGGWNFEREYDVSGERYKLEIRSDAPPITKDAKERVKIFESFYMGVISRALEEPIVSDILLRDLLETDEADLGLTMYWIPRPDELKIELEIVDKDPFVMASIYDRHYLVANWDVAGELPYEHYLKEFGMSSKNKSTPPN